MSVKAERLDFTSYQLTVTVDYTGGGGITHLNVSFRIPGSMAFTDLGSFLASRAPDSDVCCWICIVTSEKFTDLALVEFRVSVTNSRQFTAEVQVPIIETPGERNAFT